MNKYIEKIASTRLGRENLAKYREAQKASVRDGIGQAEFHGGDKVLVGPEMPKVRNALSSLPISQSKLSLDSVKYRARGRLPGGNIPKGMINTLPATAESIGNSLRPFKSDAIRNLMAIARKAK